MLAAGERTLLRRIKTILRIYRSKFDEDAMRPTKPPFYYVAKTSAVCDMMPAVEIDVIAAQGLSTAVRKVNPLRCIKRRSGCS